MPRPKIYGKRTSYCLKISTTLWDAFKERCALNHETILDALTDLILEYLSKPVKVEKGVHRLRYGKEN